MPFAFPKLDLFAAQAQVQRQIPLPFLQQQKGGIYCLVFLLLAFGNGLYAKLSTTLALAQFSLLHFLAFRGTICPIMVFTFLL